MAKPIAALAPPRGCSAARAPRTWSPRRSTPCASRCSATSIRPSTRSSTRSWRCSAEVYRARDGLVLPLQSTGTSGMEAGIANLVEPGDTVIVGVSGYFGARIAEIARAPRRARGRGRARSGGGTCRTSGCSRRSTVTRARGWWRWCTARPPPGSSTRWRSSARRCAAADTLLMADCVTTLGGVPLDFDGVGRRLRLLVHPEMPRRAARHVADRDLAARARRGSTRAHRIGPVLARPAAAARLLTSSGRPPTTTRLRSCTSTPSTRSCGGRWRRALEAALGAATSDAGRHFAASAEEAGFEVLAEDAAPAARR